jgi:hypothetical protein
VAKSETSGPVLLITPPFCQPNTPYPATTYLKGRLNNLGISSHQIDLGIHVIDRLFSAEGFTAMFREAEKAGRKTVSRFRFILSRQEQYSQSIIPVMEFLRGKQPGLAHRICSRKWLPEGPRFSAIPDLKKEFGRLGLHDKAVYLATLYLEDISDFITGAIDARFGFSRYAERLGRYANTFDELHQTLHPAEPDSIVIRTMLELLRMEIETFRPAVVAFTIPFPGNLFGALKCAQWIKKHHPDIWVVIGGGFVATELNNVTDVRVFEYVDEIVYGNNGNDRMVFPGATPGAGLGILLGKEGWPGVMPDYDGLPLDKYFSVLEMANPMHRLWSDGKWLKLMLAHGCYWAKCSFCDTTLDYISRFKPLTAVTICDQMEALMEQTGLSGFHFTDEAAPPVLLKNLANEIIRRKMTVTWWTNVRFEKMFTSELCDLLGESGCIAVSGGLEVASPRILSLINKGVTLEQVIRVTNHFTRAGIMVHAYLMYGFPTQTARETIDSLEIVRQLFRSGLIQSGFWHRFALTVHSPVAKEPNRFSIRIRKPSTFTFALNDLDYDDLQGCDHEKFGPGLRKALYNYMHGIGLNFPLQEWFDFQIPATTVPETYLKRQLALKDLNNNKE